MDSKNPQVTRRTFLKIGLAGAAVTAIGSRGISESAASETPVSPQTITPVYRTLGRTGLKISVVSFGAMLTPESEVIRASFDYGVNYIDTARRYMDGKNEEIIARAIKGLRPNLFLATKTRGTSREKIFQEVEGSLKALATDYLDVYLIHNLTNKDKERALDPKIQEALKELQKQGKIRFTGVATHTDQVDVIDMVVNDPAKFYDMVLVGYNFKSGPELKAAIARAAKSGIGIIAMKTQAGGYKTEALGSISPHQAALKWALQDPNITAAIPGMKDMAMLKENIAVMGMKLTARENRVLDLYGKAIDPYYCRLCGQCEKTCPQGVSVSVINRALMYAEAYREPELALTTYRELPAQARATACRSCSSCVARCVWGINIDQKMTQANETFA
ncbi:MAG TPA: aldo/keto reductase [Thermodesulfobacteriota bacterium]|nr:aldo/keto reductase [Thermodesulfobacteriota bacterium]